MLIIAGTQRSGTTFTAQFLFKCGFKFDENLNWDETITGGFENLSVDKFFREYIGDDTFSYKDIEKNIPDGHIIQPSLFPDGEVLKISYLLQNPVFVHILHKFRGMQDKFLILNRDKRDVYKTKKRRWDRFTKDSILLKQEPEELQYNFNKSIEILDEYGYEYESLEFPNFLNSFHAFSKTMELLGYDISDKEDVWNNLVDFDKVHFGRKTLK